MGKKHRVQPVKRKQAPWYQQRGIVIGAGVTAAVLLLAGAAALLPRFAERDKPDTAIAHPYRGIQGGYTEEGLPYLGAPDAPVTLVEFTDFGCSHCREYSLETAPGILDEYVATGKVRYVLHYYSSSGTRSMQAAEAAMCAADQGLYFQFQHALFESAAATREDFIARAEAVGLDVDAFAACWDAGQHHNELLAYIRSARAMGITATPSFKVNEQLVIGNRSDVIRQTIEDELN
jgi:protein-disulfide isomerase